jgi:hypothetical protein
LVRWMRGSSGRPRFPKTHTRSGRSRRRHQIRRRKVNIMNRLMGAIPIQQRMRLNVHSSKICAASEAVQTGQCPRSESYVTSGVSARSATRSFGPVIRRRSAAARLCWPRPKSMTFPPTSAALDPVRKLGRRRATLHDGRFSPLGCYKPLLSLSNTTGFIVRSGRRTPTTAALEGEPRTQGWSRSKTG